MGKGCLTWLWICCLAVGTSAATLVSPGIDNVTLTLQPQPQEGAAEPAGELIGIPHSAFAGTELELRLSCDAPPSVVLRARFVVRTSPCDKEFFDMRRALQFQQLLAQYFKNERFVPPGYSYDELLFFESGEQQFDCAQQNIFHLNVSTTTMRLVNVSGNASPAPHHRRRRREAPAGGNSELNSFHPALRLPVDAIYLLVVEVTPMAPLKTPVNITLTASWRASYGYLSAVDWPLLPFYGIMCALYAVYALVWFVVSACQWKDLLRIQFWIGAVILLGMVEKAVFYAEYETVNKTGQSVEGAIQLAELVSCLKRTISRILIIIVSVGFGVVKPRLGETLHKVIGVGFVYFILCSIEAISRVAKSRVDGQKQQQMVALPLVLLDVAIFWWIFTSLVGTMRALRLRRNEVKLALYRHFTNTLVAVVVASGVYMCWSLYTHVFTNCLTDWKELWLDTAFWHLLFCIILLVIMILWRPTNNNQRYAFTPLLDDDLDYDDDDDGEDTIFSDAFTTAEATKLRSVAVSGTKAERRHKDADAALEEELRWVEEHIPSSLAEKLVADSDEEAEQTKLELSKML